MRENKTWPTEQAEMLALKPVHRHCSLSNQLQFVMTMLVSIEEDRVQTKLPKGTKYKAEQNVEL